MGLPFSEASTQRPPGKAILASAPANDRVDASDWEVVRLTIAGAPKAATARLEWLNPDTGSIGTIVTAEAATGDGRTCRAFATTVNDVRGIRRYRGDACVSTGGRWQLQGVTPDDAAIS